MLCTSVFVDKCCVFIAWASGPESSTTLYFSDVHQVAPLVGHQTTSVRSSSSQCGTGREIYYLLFDCCATGMMNWSQTELREGGVGKVGDVAGWTHKASPLPASNSELSRLH